jgi:hypothetical protein
MLEILKKPFVLYLGWILLSGVFLLSVIGKLYPTPANGIEIFENDYLMPVLPAWISSDFISIFSRALLALESFFVIAFLWPNKNKKLIGYAAIALLAVFCIHLLIQVLNSEKGNCGCFGQLIEMTPLQALIKNILTIALILGVLKLSRNEEFKFSFFHYCSIFLFSLSLISLITPQKISVTSNTVSSFSSANVLLDTSNVDQAIHIGLDLNLNNKLDENEYSSTYSIRLPKSGNSVDSVKNENPGIVIETKGPTSVFSQFNKLVPGIDSGRKILCYYDPTCSHCILTHKKLKQLSATKGFPTVHVVFSNKQPDKIPDFWEMTGYKTLFSVITDEQSKEFVFTKKLLKKPSVYFLNNGNIWYNFVGKDDAEIDINALKTAIQREK